MKLSRSELREKAMTILYQIFMYQSSNIDYNIDNVIKEHIDIQNDFINDLAGNILSKKEELFKISNNYLKQWKMERLSKIDQAIICIGIYELLYTDTPDIVCINEAVELAKKYSDDKVKKMINGVLDNVYQNK